MSSLPSKTFALCSCPVSRLVYTSSKQDLSTQPSTCQRELDAAARRHGAPVSLVGRGAAVADAGRLPRLVKGLEVEDVDTPRLDAADACLEERLRVGRRSDSTAVV